MGPLQNFLYNARSAVGETQGDGPYGLTGRAWCAAAMALWLLSAGYRVSEGRPRRGAKALGRDLGKRHGYRSKPRSWATSLAHAVTGRWKNIPIPVVGDVLVYHRGKGVKDRWKGHVVVVVAVYADGSIETIGGNENPKSKTTIAPKGKRGRYVCHRRVSRRYWARRLYCAVALGGR